MAKTEEGHGNGVNKQKVKTRSDLKLAELCIWCCFIWLLSRSIGHFIY